MADANPDREESEPIEVRCYFVRERNALLVRGEFSSLFTDYYLHLMEHQIRYEASLDQLLKDGLAALTLYLATRPWNEAVAWTLNWQDPLLNLFVTGSNRLGNVTGRVFTEDVKARDNNLLFAQTTVDGKAPRQSMIEVEELDIFHVGEHLYLQSEQRLGRYFHISEEDVVLITAQPDCDLTWLKELQGDQIRDLDQHETLSLLEKREYRFHCGCSQDRIFPLIAGMSEDSIDSLFGESETMPTGCPRCGARFVITRESLEAFVSARKDEKSGSKE
ncbi:MAG: Hsp33 family molecular chaperone HslO [Verrucomicrobiota bacterium]